MVQRLEPSEKTLPLLVDTSTTLPRLEPSEVAMALGAEPCAAASEGGSGPITLFALRQELFKRVCSGGGPEPSGATSRVSLDVSDQQWHQLEQLAAVIASPGFAPSASQVARGLLTLSLKAVTAQLSQSGSEASGSPLVRELSATTAAASER